MSQETEKPKIIAGPADVEIAQRFRGFLPVVVDGLQFGRAYPRHDTREDDRGPGTCCNRPGREVCQR